MRLEFNSSDKGTGEIKIFLEYVVPLVQVFMSMCLTSETEKGNDEEKERGMITLGERKSTSG